VTTKVLILIIRSVVNQILEILDNGVSAAGVLEDRAPGSIYSYLTCSIARLADDIFLYQLCQPEIVKFRPWIFLKFKYIVHGKGVCTINEPPDFSDSEVEESDEEE
jgi:hypothetical protein